MSHDLSPRISWKPWIDMNRSIFLTKKSTLLIGKRTNVTNLPVVSSSQSVQKQKVVFVDLAREGLVYMICFSRNSKKGWFSPVWVIRARNTRILSVRKQDLLGTTGSSTVRRSLITFTLYDVMYISVNSFWVPREVHICSSQIPSSASNCSTSQAVSILTPSSHFFVVIYHYC